jgi:hypothetical protein
MSEVGTPSDLEGLEQQLRRHLGSQVRELRMAVADGYIVLQGIAVSYYAKQLAQHLALRALGAAALVNRIDVRPAAPAHEDGGAKPE